MGKVLLADGSSGSPAFVQKDFGSPITPTWEVHFDLLILSAAFTSMALDQFTSDVNQVIGNGTGGSDGTGITGWHTDGTPDTFNHGNKNWLTDFGPLTPEASFTPDTWLRSVVVTFNGTTVTWAYGGATLFSYANDVGDLQTIEIGAIDPNGVANEFYYFDNVEVYDSTHSLVFSDDFESGGLSAWTSTTGAVSVVDDPVGPPPPSADFTIATDPAFADITICLPTTGTACQTVPIVIGEVGDPETVNLSLDTSDLLTGMTAMLSASSGTTPFTVTLTVCADTTTPSGSTDINVIGTDGTNTHDTSFFPTIHLEICCTNTKGDDLQAGAQAGSDFGVNFPAAPIRLCEHAGDLYAAWAENDPSTHYTHGPYLAVWTGSAWSAVIASWDESTQFSDAVAQSVTGIELVSDGTNLYLGFLARYSITQTAPNIAGPTVTTIAPYALRLLKWTGGGSFTDLGWFVLGQTGVTLPPNPSTISESAVRNLSVFGWRPETGSILGQTEGYIRYELAASSDEVGSCYLTLYEDGYSGSTTGFEAIRHLYIAGMDGSAMATVDLTSSLTQPPFPPGPGDPTAGLGYICRLAGSGSNLTWYGLDYDILDGGSVPTWTVMHVWQKGGFLGDLTLASDFGGGGVNGGILLSNDLANKRLVGFTNTVSGTSVGTIREFDLAAPDTPGDLKGRWQLNSLATSGDLWQEPGGDVWSSMGVGNTGRNRVALLDCRCGQKAWWLTTHFFPASDWGNGLGPPVRSVLFGDAIWAPGILNTGGSDHPVVYRLPICRGCAGDCVGGLHVWQRV